MINHVTADSNRSVYRICLRSGEWMADEDREAKVAIANSCKEDPVVDPDDNAYQMVDDLVRNDVSVSIGPRRCSPVFAAVSNLHLLTNLFCGFNFPC